MAAGQGLLGGEHLVGEGSFALLVRPGEALALAPQHGTGVCDGTLGTGG